METGAVGGAVAALLAAFAAAVDDNKALAGVGFGADGVHDAAAGICPVSREVVHVERAEAEGTVVAGGFPQRENLFAAVLAEKTAVVLLKAFGFGHVFGIFAHLKKFPCVFRALRRILRLSV